MPFVFAAVNAAILELGNLPTRVPDVQSHGVDPAVVLTLLYLRFAVFSSMVKRRALGHGSGLFTSNGRTRHVLKEMFVCNRQTGS